VFASLIGMCILGYFAIKLLVRVLAFPEAVTSAFVVMFCFMGAMASRSTAGDLWVLVAFGILGYLFERYSFPIAPMVLGAILGPLAETSFMSTMISFSNDWTVFFTRPVSGAILALGLVALGYPLISDWTMRLRKRRQSERTTAS
jgi:putative tricarboxylic transport membrane protein